MNSGKKTSRRSRSKKPRSAKLRSAKSQSAKSRSAKTTAYGIRQDSETQRDYNLTELQTLAKSKGIPFGGLSKGQLMRKLNNY